MKVRRLRIRRPSGAPPGKKFLQIYLQPTRTRIYSIGAGGTSSPRIRRGRSHITIGPFEDVDSLPEEIPVSYEGEPLRRIGNALVNEAGLLDDNELIARWIKCRQKHASKSFESEFFLRLDIEFHPDLNIHFSDQERRTRSDSTQEIYRKLRNRLVDRANPAIGINKIERASEGDAPHFLLVEAIMRSHFVHCFKSRRDDERRACEWFAAGRLRQECVINDRAPIQTIAGDADSAAIFMFAEFALVISEIWQDAVSGAFQSPIILKEIRSQLNERIAADWAERAEFFARMQWIYLERWKEHFGADAPYSAYNGSARPIEIEQVPPVPTEFLGQNGKLNVAAFIRSNVMRTTIGGRLEFEDDAYSPQGDDSEEVFVVP